MRIKRLENGSIHLGHLPCFSAANEYDRMNVQIHYTERGSKGYFASFTVEEESDMDEDETTANTATIHLNPEQCAYLAEHLQDIAKTYKVATMEDILTK